jgi:hypothetical protein
MAKRKQPKSTARKKAKGTTSAKQSTDGGQRGKLNTKSGLGSTVRSMFKRTVARIKEIEARALEKLRGKDGGK